MMQSIQKRYGVWAASLIGVLVMGYTVGFRASDNPENSSGQPINFNHQKHVQSNVQCKKCHLYASEYAKAGLPSVSVCIQCHEDVIYVTPDKEKILASQRSGIDLAWKQVTKLAGYVYFSHRRHTAQGKIECTVCHANVAQWNVAPVTGTWKLTMNDCIDCHEKNHSKTKFTDLYNCNRCHR
jgi:c(7)-type cytochrome triheme protein